MRRTYLCHACLRPPMTFRLLFLSLSMPLFAASVCAQSTLADRLEGLRLESSVLLALAESAEMRGFDVTVEAAEGVVVLSGLVSAIGIRDHVVELIAELPGVRVVRSTLRLEGQPNQPLADPPVRLGPDEMEIAAERPEELEPPETLEAGPNFYTVRRGDTLYGIARRHDTTVDALSQLNNLRSTSLRVGRRLRVK